MSAFLGVPVDAAFHVVSLLVSALTPLLGGLAAAAAIVGATIAVRLFLLPLSYRAIAGDAGPGPGGATGPGAAEPVRRAARPVAA